METPDGELYLFLTDPDGAYFTGQSGTLEPADPDQVDTNGSGTVTGYDDATALDRSSRRATCRRSRRTHWR